MRFPRHWLSGGRSSRANTDRLYDAVLTRAFEPALYASKVVDDTFEGRFQMVTIFSALIMRELRRCGIAGNKQSQRLNQKVLSGFDHAFREGGTSDARIARKMRKLGEEYYGLARAIDDALAQPNVHLSIVDALTRNDIGPASAQDLATHFFKASQTLGRLSEAELLEGRFTWQTYASMEQS